MSASWLCRRFGILGRMPCVLNGDRAIWIAKRCGVPLKIAAKVDAVDRDYFESEIRKMLAPPDVEYIGEISDDASCASCACVRPASTRAALNCRPETILVVDCLMDAYSTVTYWAACLYQIRGYLAVLNGPA